MSTNRLNSDEARKKRKETIKNNLKQVALFEETETIILLDYFERKIKIYSNKATVMNRLERLGYKPTGEDKVDGEICSRSYEFEADELGNFLRAGIFKF